MAKQTVDEFIIEMGFSEKVMKGLAKLEKQIQPVAKRIEDRLNKAFKVDAAKQAQPGINRLVKSAESASRKIHKSLNSAFDIKNAGRASMRGFENQSSAMARRIAKEIQKAYNVRAPKLPPIPNGGRGRGGSGGAGGGAGPRPPRGGSGRNTANWIESHFNRSTDNGMTNSMLNLGMNRQLTAMRGRLRGLADVHKNDATTHEYEKNARAVIFEYKRQVAAQRAANKQLEQSKFMQHSLESSTMNLVSGFASVYKALEFFQGSLEEGVKRTQAHTMAVSAYGDEQTALAMTMKADEVSRKYGLDRADTREQMAQMRMTMPTSFDNDKIAKLFESESVFAHNTGMSPDAVGRLNYAMQQIAATPHLMAQDWNQVTNAAPALVQKMVQQYGVKNAKELKEKAKGKTGAQFVEDMMTAMEPTQRQMEMAQKNLQVSQRNLTSAIKDSQDQMFRGEEEGMRQIFDSLTGLLEDSSGNFRDIGRVIGWIAEKLAPVVYGLDTIFMNIDGYIGLFKEKIAELEAQSPFFDKTIKALEGLAGLGVQVGAILLAMKLLKSWSGWVISFMNIFGGLGGAGAAAAVGGEAAAAGAAVGGEVALGGLTASMGASVAAFLPAILPIIVTTVVAYMAAKVLGDAFGGPQKDLDKSGMYYHDSPVGEYVIDPLRDLWKDVKGGFNQAMNAPLFPGDTYRSSPGMPGQNMMTFAPLQVEFLGKGEVEVKMPDGSVQKIAMDVVQRQHEVQMMSATGLQETWKPSGSNAGYKPSSLFTKPGGQ